MTSRIIKGKTLLNLTSVLYSSMTRIYVELAEQYAVMDAASNVVKRNLLAQHLREVIDILEQKGDQIASLYDLLQFKDRPLSEPFRTSSPPLRDALKRHPTVP
jgi:hypothetical protein